MGLTLAEANKVISGAMAKADEIAEYIFYLVVHNNFVANEVINITGGE